jgi:hypothetical protein
LPDVELKPESIVWLDKYNVLMRHIGLLVEGDVKLTQYARRPDPQLS